MSNKKSYNYATMRMFLEVLVNNKIVFGVSLLYFVAAVTTSTVIPLLISQTLASLVIEHGASIDRFLPALAIAALIAFLFNMIGYEATLRLNSQGQYLLNQRLINKLLRHSAGFHTNQVSGKIISNAVEYSSSYGRLVDTLYVQGVPFILSVVIGIGVVFVNSWQIGLALTSVVTIILGMAVFESLRRSRLRGRRKKAQNAAIAHLSDTIINVQAVKTFASEAREEATQEKLADNLRALRQKDWSGASRYGATRLGVLLALQIVFIAYIAHLLNQDQSILAIGIFAFAYTITLTNRLFEIGGIVRNIEESLLQASTMTQIMEQPAAIIDAPNATNLHVTKGSIDVKDMHFSYNAKHRQAVFSKLSFTIPAGQKIGLVGPSGGGKSTLTRLLLRFDDLDSGEVCIDGQNIATITQASLRQAISYVPQEPLLFHRSIKENIAYGKLNATDKEIEHAAKLAYADDFIKKLSEGYDTIVGERGVKLSGGQRQRIAIARAILKDAPILVLDEATSALDSESEVAIQKALEELMKNKTSIVIAHRLSTISKLDRIIVLDNGAISEDGTHQQLVKKKGTYAKLWSHQSGGFIEE